MKNEIKTTLEINPTKGYRPPDIPTLETVRNKPALLRPLPFRWRNNAAVLACVGMIGVLSLSGCGSVYNETPAGNNGYYNGNYIGNSNGAYNGENNGGDIPDNGPYNVYNNGIQTNGRDEIYANHIILDLNVRTHYGGSGAGPIYVAYLTEQEALSIIRSKLEAAGLRLSAVPPGYTVDPWRNDSNEPLPPMLFTPRGWGQSVELNLFDAESSVAAAFVDWYVWDDLNEQIVNGFKQQTDINVGVFGNTGKSIGTTEWWEPDHRPPTYEEIEEARPIITQILIDRVQAFINLLEEQRII